jgi:hypothetical protein
MGETASIIDGRKVCVSKWPDDASPNDTSIANVLISPRPVPPETLLD